MKQLDVELKRFMQISSHHLQEPLRNIVSFLQLFDRHQNGKMDPQAREYIEYAVEGSIWMKHLINDLNSYSNINMQKPALGYSSCISIVNKALVPLRPKIKRLKAEVTIEWLPELMGDKIKLIRLFQDLVGNSLKFIGTETPQINISAERLRNADDGGIGSVGADSQSGAWLFSVKDNGIGIEKQYYEKIFDVFHKLHIRTKYHGTGIGLAICRAIVEQHGGRIWVESEAGKGSTFYFTIPILEEKNE
jgi:light-regulated signal transduction histidine kinase (bacteriophytochrome)